MKPAEGRTAGRTAVRDGMDLRISGHLCFERDGVFFVDISAFMRTQNYTLNSFTACILKIIEKQQKL